MDSRKQAYIDELLSKNLKPNFAAVNYYSAADINARLKDLNAEHSLFNTLVEPKELGSYTAQEEFKWKEHPGILTDVFRENNGDLIIIHSTEKLTFNEVRNAKGKIKSYSLECGIHLLCKNICLETAANTFNTLFGSRKYAFDKLQNFAVYLRTTGALSVLLLGDESKWKKC